MVRDAGSKGTGGVADATHSLGHTASGFEQEPAPELLVPGQRLGRYQVRRLVGQGGMAHVYLARDLGLGRSIALKLVTTSHAGQFLDEARTIALLNHPHIVQLYDFGEHDGRVYLALEYIDGESLRERMKTGRIGIDESLRHLCAIAEALEHAHAAGVIHCDLKPANIMFGKDGRLRVVDFGIARTLDAALSIGGTRDWMAPEQTQRGRVSVAADVWALGLLALELLTGGTAKRDEPIPDVPGVPEGAVQLIRQSLERDPARRPTMRRWLSVIKAMQRGDTEKVSVEAPFPGLASFDERYANVFFGRESAVDEFLERLRESPLLPIVGASGTGKSSFLLAGVIPRLRSMESWRVIVFRPGSDPIGALARQLTVAFDTVEDVRGHAAALRDELYETPTLLAARCATLASTLRCRVLIAVDQLEEVFTHGCSTEHRERFMEMLRTANDDPDDPIRVIVTVRDDFVGRLPWLRSLFVLQHLTVDDLRRVIVNPLERANYDVDDPTLVGDLVAELATAGPAGLPMLQFACRTLWESRDRERRHIRRETYEAMGGLTGALARHAERAMAEFSTVERRIARGILLQLVVGATRKSVRRDELVGSTDDVARAEGVLDRLVAARLLVQRSTDDGEQTLIEIAHESLLVSWTQLARWIEESRDERRVLEELGSATELWERRGKRAEETWSAVDIANARGRIAQLDVGLPMRLEQFLSAGEARHRRLRRRRMVAYGIAVATAVAVAIPATLLISRYLAREQLIANNTGTVEFVLQPYDWMNDRMVPVPIAELPELSWTLYRAAASDPHVPGATANVERLAERREATALVARARAAGGVMFLSVTGRGRKGEHCAASWVRMQAFPGYVEGSVERVVIDVPTCRTSAANTLAVPAGPFIYGGPGDPPSRHYNEPDYTRPERIVELAAFAMDRTEVSNAMFAPFAQLASVTGYPPPVYSKEAVHTNDASPSYPVTAINSLQAAAFCRYMGKSLPTDEEWVKAARGGLMLDGVANPAPRRAYPWGARPAPACVNQSGDGDPDPWVSPVDAYGCGAGPYGHLNLVGNVNEWIATDERPLTIIRGGSVSSPPELEHTTTIFINHRNPIAFDYAIGVRCVTRTERTDNAGVQ